MPRDMENARRLYAHHSKVNPNVGVKIRKDSGILEAIDKAIKGTSVTRSDYMREALREALIRDGYMSEEE